MPEIMTPGSREIRDENVRCWCMMFAPKNDRQGSFIFGKTSIIIADFAVTIDTFHLTSRSNYQILREQCLK